MEGIEPGRHVLPREEAMESLSGRLRASLCPSAASSHQPVAAILLTNEEAGAQMGQEEKLSLFRRRGRGGGSHARSLSAGSLRGYCPAFHRSGTGGTEASNLPDVAQQVDPRGPEPLLPSAMLSFPSGINEAAPPLSWPSFTPSGSSQTPLLNLQKANLNLTDKDTAFWDHTEMSGMCEGPHQEEHTRKKLLASRVQVLPSTK